MKNITVFTPTYNRCEKLNRLYESLKLQSDLDFKWLIIDDGSSDNTKDLVNKIIDENKIETKYVYQKNSGKYKAYNKAVEICDTDYMICVDSDDYLLDKAISKLKFYINKIKLHEKEDILGFFFPRFDKSGKNYLINQNFKKMDIMDLKFEYKKNIETGILVKTSYSKLCIFPLIADEKFLSEEIIYIDMSKYGKFIYIEDFDIYVNDYQQDGLTKNIYNVWKKSVISTLYFLNKRYKYLDKYNLKIRWINRIKTIININALCIECNKNILKNTSNRLLSILLFIPSIIWRKKFFK